MKNGKNYDKTNRRNNQLPQIQHKIRLLNDSIIWLYVRKIKEDLNNTTETTYVKTEWCII
jgi:hypothetical protein